MTVSPAGPAEAETPGRPEGSAATPARRLRFAAALLLFGCWVVALAILAMRADPPRPIPAGADAPAPADRQP